MKPIIEPSVSSIIPVYNGERFLAETLESILAQSYPIHEVIVVDDGSTDGTAAVVEAYAERYGKCIRYLWQPNSGPAAARNAGIQVATSEFVAFLDADDLWHAQKTARQLACFAARPELAVSVTHVQNFWMDEVRDEEQRLPGHARTQPVAGYVAQSILTRRQIFAEIGLFDATLQHASIAKWFLQVEEAGLVVEVTPEVLVMRRLHRDNRSRLLANNSRQEYLQLFYLSRARKRSQAMPNGSIS